jgi:hypothetical protein
MGWFRGSRFVLCDCANFVLLHDMACRPGLLPRKDLLRLPLAGTCLFSGIPFAGVLVTKNDTKITTMTGDFAHFIRLFGAMTDMAFCNTNALSLDCRGVVHRQLARTVRTAVARTPTGRTPRPCRCHRVPNAWHLVVFDHGAESDRDP